MHSSRDFYEEAALQSGILCSGFVITLSRLMGWRPIACPSGFDDAVASSNFDSLQSQFTQNRGTNQRPVDFITQPSSAP